MCDVNINVQICINQDDYQILEFNLFCKFPVFALRYIGATYSYLVLNVMVSRSTESRFV